MAPISPSSPPSLIPENMFLTIPDLNDSDERNEMLKTPSKILTESKVMHVLKLCKLVNKLHPHYCLDVILQNVIFNVMRFLSN